MENIEWARSVSSKIKDKMLVVAERNREKIPYRTFEGIYDDLSGDDGICWWTNGFWGGIMWQMYNATKNEMYRDIAIENEIKLDKVLMTSQGLDHDNGFKWLPTAVANYRLTGNLDSKNRGDLAVTNLAGRFNPVGNYIRAWNDFGSGTSNAGWAIIDCMMNLPLLYWAYEESLDPRYLHIAKLHAETAKKYFVREDGSVNHICVFDPMNGEYIESLGGQGYGVGSSWTRGQSWALYGFILSYIHTKDESYLNTAKRVANYFISNIPENNLIPVDFRQPQDCKLEDSTATSIAACGLIEISRYVPKEEAHVYYDRAIKLLKTLDKERSNWSTDIDNILEKCTAAFHDKEHEFTIVYADYFFIEAIFKLTGEELFIW